MGRFHDFMQNLKNMGKIDLLWPSLAKLTPLPQANVANLGIPTRPRPKAWPGCVASFRQSAVRSPFICVESGMAGRQRPHVGKVIIWLPEGHLIHLRCEHGRNCGGNHRCTVFHKSHVEYWIIGNNDGFHCSFCEFLGIMRPREKWANWGVWFSSLIGVMLRNPYDKFMIGWHPSPKKTTLSNSWTSQAKVQSYVQAGIKPAYHHTLGSKELPFVGIPFCLWLVLC